MAVALLAGWLAGAVWAALAVVLAAFAVWQALEFDRLERWAERPLRRPAQLHPLWREPVEAVYRAVRRARGRQRLLLRHLRRLRGVSDALPDASVILGAAGEIEAFNAAAQRLLNLGSQDIGVSITALVRSPEFVAMMRDEADLAEFASPFAEGVRLEARRFVIDADSTLLLVRDVTELNRLLSMRQEFVANVSHELRTPLTVVIGYIEALTEGGLDEAERGELIERLAAPTLRMKALVDDLLLLTRLESSPPPGDIDLEDIDMCALIREVLEEVPAPQGIEVRVDCAEVRLRGVRGEIHSAVTNLITNAFRYSPGGGEVRVTWRTDGDGVLAVTDQGVGIAREHLARLTERFYRVDLARARIRGGTGLGLAIVKHVLKRHDGELHITSTPGRGSRFECRFPPGRLRAGDRSNPPRVDDRRL